MRQLRTLLAVTACAAAGCRSAEGSRPARPLTVAVVFDGGRGDLGFNDAAVAGAERAQRELGVHLNFVEAEGEADDPAARLRRAARDSADVVIGVGFVFGDALERVAGEFPRTRFAGIDVAPRQDSAGRAIPLPGNLTGLAFREDEGAFLVGAIAALSGGAKRVGFVGGMESSVVRRFESGYRAGVLHVCPDCTVLVDYAGTTPAAFQSPDRGEALALKQYRAGAKVVFHAAGLTGLGVFRAAQRTGRYAIGADVDQASLAPGRVVTSMTKGIDVAVYEIVRRAARGELVGGQTLSLGLAEGGVGYVYDSASHPLIRDDVHMRVEQLRQAVIAGVLRPRAARS